MEVAELGLDEQDTVRKQPPFDQPLDPLVYRTSFLSVAREKGVGAYSAPHRAVALTPHQQGYTPLVDKGYKMPILRPTKALEALHDDEGIWYPFDLLAGHLRDAVRGKGPLRSLPSSLIMFEADKLQKTCLQSGAMPHWQRDYNMVVPDWSGSFSPHATAFVDTWFATAAAGYRELRRKAREITNIWEYVGVPRGTNSGWPDYDQTDQSKTMHLMLSLGLLSPDDWSVLGEFVGQTPYGIFFSRTGHTSKFLQAWQVEGNGYTSPSAFRGLATRRRAVMGIPTLLGATERAVMKVLTLAKKHYGWLKIELPHVTWAANVHYSYHYSDDLSNFDGTFSPSHFAWLRSRYAKLHDLSGTAWLYEKMQTIEMLTPGLDRGTGFALVRDGYEASGVPHTSNDDTALNGGSFFDCILASTSFDADTVFRDLQKESGAGELSLKILGDDTDLASSRPIDADAIKSTRSQHGLISKREVDSFLMTWYPTWEEYQEGYLACGSFARYLQQALFPERFSEDEDVQFIGQVERFWRIRFNPIWRLIGHEVSRIIFERGFGVPLNKLEEAAQAILDRWASELKAGILTGDAFDYLQDFVRREVPPQYGPLAELISRYGYFFSTDSLGNDLALALLRRDSFTSMREVLSLSEVYRWLKLFTMEP